MDKAQTREKIHVYISLEAQNKTRSQTKNPVFKTLKKKVSHSAGMTKNLIM